MSHHTTIIVTTEKNNNITNFHSVLKMKTIYKDLMFKLLFVHKGGFVFESFQETFKSHFGYGLD
jgi:hypothetical protein